MKNLNHYLLLSPMVAVASLALSSCTGILPLERLPDPDQTRMEKFLLERGRSGETVGSQPQQWLGKVTVVRTSTGGGFAFTGFQSDTFAGHFEFTPDYLRFISDTTPYIGDDETRVGSVMQQWDITHHDVRLDEQNGRTANREVEDEETPVMQRRFFKTNFADGLMDEKGFFPWTLTRDLAQCVTKKASSVVPGSLASTGSYFTYTVRVDYQLDLCSADLRRLLRGEMTYSVEYKYSLKALQTNDYPEYVYQGGAEDPLRRKFGYFQTSAERVNPVDGRRQTANLMKRFHPNKQHKFYFTREFPEHYKPIMQDIFAKTNTLFEGAGLAIRFTVHEAGGRKFGDIRYSFVNFTEEIQEGSPLGYGPSDANPFTGEIVSSNLMIWTGSLKHYLQRIRTRLGRNADRSNRSIYLEMTRLLEGQAPSTLVSELDLTEGAGKWIHDLLPQLTFGRAVGYAYGRDGVARVSEVPNSRLAVDLSRSSQALGLQLSDLPSHGRPSHPALQSVQDLVEAARSKMIDSDLALLKPEHAVIMEMEPAIAGAIDGLIEGKTPQQISDQIVYRTAIHELGHNLGLRHNFAGSVDKRNFREHNGSELETPVTSSVMDYLDIHDELHLARDWEPYDKAALKFAYSSGSIDDSAEKKYLFCTDEHRSINALCNTWDKGSSPTQIIMSMIKQYEDRYHVINMRNGRAYWDTSSYDGYVFGVMANMKKFLPFWRSALNSDRVNQLVREKDPSVTDPQLTELNQGITLEMINANRLAMAFYASVVAQTSAERPYQSTFDEWSGQIKKIGIASDKIFAVMFLLGDDRFQYDPNRPRYNESYLTYADSHPAFSQLSERVYERFLTERVDMEPWFIGFGRALYAMNSTNPYNRSNVSLLNRIKVTEFDETELSHLFGITWSPDQDTINVTLAQSGHNYYQVGEQVGVTRVNDKLFMVSKSRAPFSATVFQKIRNAQRFGNSGIQSKRDLLELYRLYRAVSAR